MNVTARPYEVQLLSQVESVHGRLRRLSTKESEKEEILFERIMRLNSRRQAAEKRFVSGLLKAVFCTVCENYIGLYRKRQ